jgi:hypothetical protein
MSQAEIIFNDQYLVNGIMLSNMQGNGKASALFYGYCCNPYCPLCTLSQRTILSVGARVGNTAYRSDERSIRCSAKITYLLSIAYLMACENNVKFERSV